MIRPIETSTDRGAPTPTIVDLTQALDSTSLTFPLGDPAWIAEALDVNVPGITVTRLSRCELHAGTHIDAPLHFAPGGADVAALPLRLLPLTVVSLPSGALRIDADCVPSACAGRAILFATGWPDRTDRTDAPLGYPPLDSSAARALVERSAALVGVDTPSVDPVSDRATYPAHRILCGAGVPIVEGLVNLAALAGAGADWLFAAFPLNLCGVEASPVRAAAFSLAAPFGPVATEGGRARTARA